MTDLKICILDNIAAAYGSKKGKSDPVSLNSLCREEQNKPVIRAKKINYYLILAANIKY
jgi:hypothetical protein